MDGEEEEGWRERENGDSRLHKGGVQAEREVVCAKGSVKIQHWDDVSHVKRTNIISRTVLW